MKYLKIKKNTEFSKIFKRGNRVFSPAVTLIFIPSDEMKMGIALTKNHKKAVVRNRIKRLLREVYNKNFHILNGNYSIIILPKVADAYDFSTFERSLLICFNKINLCQRQKKS